MPIIKYKDVLLHFAHIPKCGGTSVERYVQGLNGVSIAFLDERYVASPPRQHWNISSPQHIDGESVGRLFPKDFFTAFFAIVRDPISRLESGYRFQRLVERKIGTMTFDEFVKTGLKDNYLTKGWMDNHFYPQSGFLYPAANYQVFKLEDKGTEYAKAFIDAALFGNTTARQIPHSNKLKLPESFDREDLVLSREALELAQDLYSMDFDNFGYERQAAEQPQPELQPLEQPLPQAAAG
jgi:hypothetical protein